MYFKQKVDQLGPIEHIGNNYQQQHQTLPSYFLWEQLNITVNKVANFGYGIAISGGLSGINSHEEQESPIRISDVLRGGPAENKLKLVSLNNFSLIIITKWSFLKELMI